MTKSTTANSAAPVDQPVDREVLEFRAGFEAASPIDEIVRDGARRMLQTAIDLEVTEFIDQHAGRVDNQGRRQVVRNGYLPGRKVLTGAGPLEVQQPRVPDKSPDVESRVIFTPSILPPYLKRTKAIEELIPWLYLKGVSTGDFSEALQALVGEQAKGLSANVVVRLKEQWSSEFDAWSRRDLSTEQYVYVWADGIHVNVRLEDDANKKQCILVLMGATADGTKKLIAIQDGYRESEQCWKELLLDVQRRGMTIAPRLAVGDGALGFWAAVRKVFPETAEQRCWFHKSGNILSKMPGSVQPRAKKDLHEISMAQTREAADRAFDIFLEKYDAKYPAACECLRKDRDVLLTFQNFPAEHWAHLRTTNPIESTFATIRLRHRRTKGSGSRRTSLAMMFKLAESAARKWRRLRGHELLVHVIKNHPIKDGIVQEDAA